MFSSTEAGRTRAICYSGSKRYTGAAFERKYGRSNKITSTGLSHDSCQKSKRAKNVFVINNFFRAWGHCFLYDAETLVYALYTSGFSEIKLYKPGVSEDPNLQSLESHGKKLKAEDINQFEIIVVEGRKERCFSTEARRSGLVAREVVMEISGEPNPFTRLSAWLMPPSPQRRSAAR